MSGLRLPIVVIVALALSAFLALAVFSSAEAAQQDGATKEKTDDAAKEQTDAATTTEGTTQEGPITIQNHSWDKYHWARPAGPFTIRVGNNVSSAWGSYLQTASNDWSADTYPSPPGTNGNLLNTQIVQGKSNRNCRATNGRIEVCNRKYGNNGWLGIATIWVSGDHITQGTAKLNDTYFQSATYNTPAWRSLVMCQEVGHDFGLAHQDENFDNNNLNTCMDYTRLPDSNQHPNAHDYEQLGTIYSHPDSSTTIGQTSASSTGNDNEPGDNRRAWGREIFRAENGRYSVFEKELANGKKKVTHVLWTLERAEQHRGNHQDEHEE
jgi:hypothetical protein